MRKTREDSETSAEYDFRGGVRGKYAQRCDEGTNVIVLDPDVAEHFPDREAVHASLRSLVSIIKRRRKSVRPARR